MKKEPVIILSPIRILNEINSEELRIYNSDHENIVKTVQKRNVRHFQIYTEPTDRIMRQPLYLPDEVIKNYFDRIIEEYDKREFDYIYVQYFNEFRLLLSKMKVPCVLLFPPKGSIQEYNDSIPRDLPFNVVTYIDRWIYNEITEKDEKEFEEETFACKMRLGENYLSGCHTPYDITIQTMEQIRSIFLYTLNDSKIYEEYE